MKRFHLTVAVCCSVFFNAVNPARAQETNFITVATPHVGTYPVAIVAADVNGDGKMDLISANNGADTLTVLTNNGSGGFVVEMPLAADFDPVSVTAADVNGDQKVDLISASYDSAGGGSTLDIFTNNGTGRFAASARLTVSSPINSVTAADVNGDNHMDLICQNSSTSSLTILTNNGHGVFTVSSTPGTGSATGPQAVTAADVNGDGKVDLITANINGTLTVLTNNSHGIFTISSTPGVGSEPFGVTAADINGDGKMDLISANENGDSMTVLTNNGAGGFVASATLGTGHNPWMVAAADVNGDGKVDLISANFNGDTLSVYTNSGSGKFGLFDTVGVGNSSIAVAAADVNGDGKPDLICVNEIDSTLSVLLNNLPGGQLKIAFVGSVGLVSWPVPFGGSYTLQTSTNLITANWQTASNAVATNSSRFSVTITNVPPSRFFRLQPK